MTWFIIGLSCTVENDGRGPECNDGQNRINPSTRSHRSYHAFHENSRCNRSCAPRWGHAVSASLIWGPTPSSLAVSIRILPSALRQPQVAPPEQHRQMRRGQGHLAVLDGLPEEPTLLQRRGGLPGSLDIPPDHLDPITLPPQNVSVRAKGKPDHQMICATGPWRPSGNICGLAGYAALVRAICVTGSHANPPT